LCSIRNRANHINSPVVSVQTRRLFSRESVLRFGGGVSRVG